MKDKNPPPQDDDNKAGFDDDDDGGNNNEGDKNQSGDKEWNPDDYVGSNPDETWKKISDVIYDKDGKPKFEYNFDYQKLRDSVFNEVRRHERKRRVIVYALAGCIVFLILSVSIFFYLYLENRVIILPYADEKRVLDVSGDKFFIAPRTKGYISISEFDGKVRAYSSDGELFIEKSSDGVLLMETDSISVRFSEGSINIIELGPYSKVSVESGSHVEVSTKDGNKYTLSEGQEYRHYPGIRGVVNSGADKMGSWRYGYFAYSSEPIGLILLEIERNYLVSIIKNGAFKNDILVTGFFNRNQDVHSVLDSILPEGYSVTVRNDSTYVINPVVSIDK